MQSLTLTKEQLQKMIAHVDSHAPLEACGLLAGLNSKVEAVLEVTNQAQSEVRFRDGSHRAVECLRVDRIQRAGI